MAVRFRPDWRCTLELWEVDGFCQGVEACVQSWWFLCVYGFGLDLKGILWMMGFLVRWFLKKLGLLFGWLEILSEEENVGK